MTMRSAKAIEVLIDIASRWGENYEEGLSSRVEHDDTDERCAEIAEESGVELEDVTVVRDLWQALDLANSFLAQRGCEGFDPAVDDGYLTTLMDIVIFG